MGSMDVSFILFHFNNSMLIHFLVFHLERKSDKISKRCMNQAYCWIKVGNTFIVQDYIISCVKNSYFSLTVISFCHVYGKFPTQRCT